jgi:ABC-type uncharacterized transport system substrate-binding protein
LGWSAFESVTGPDKTAPDKRPTGENVVIALGSMAMSMAAKSGGDRPVVAALVTRAAVDEATFPGDRWSAIVLEQPADRWADLIHAAFPGRQTLGILVGPLSRHWPPRLARKLEERHFGLIEEPVASADDLVPSLESLLSRVSVLLALPDPSIHNRNTVQPLLLTTYRARVPVVAYSESYLQAGAVIALYSTPSQISAQVVETVLQLREGRIPVTIQAPRYFTVGVNATVARSLGLALPSGSELKDRLRSVEQ